VNLSIVWFSALSLLCLYFLIHQLRAIVKQSGSQSPSNRI